MTVKLTLLHNTTVYVLSTVQGEIQNELEENEIAFSAVYSWLCSPVAKIELQQ